jgi:hypothetical protein
MNTDHRNPRFRRGFAFVALAAVLGLSALGLSQCRMVNDTVTGVDLQSNSSFGSKGRSACKKACNEEFKQCKKLESAKHKIEKKACDQLPSTQKKECKKAESLRHKAAKKECSERKKACKRACKYTEGAGSAGR